MASVTLLSDRDVSDDVIHLMVKGGGRTWRHLVGAKMAPRRDSVAFQLNEPVKRLLVRAFV